jgi:hypothetical protein
MPAMGILRIVVLAVLLAGCASAQTDSDKARPVKEVVSGGARIRGGGLRMDVQVGRPFAQQPMRNDTITATPNAVVNR